MIIKGQRQESGFGKTIFLKHMCLFSCRQWNNWKQKQKNLNDFKIQFMLHSPLTVHFVFILIAGNHS